MKKHIFALIFILVAGFNVFSQPKDLLVLLDTSAGMSSHFQNTNDYLTGSFLRENLNIGDTFHLISYSESPRLEISRRIDGLGDLEAIIGRILLMYPLDPRSDLSAALAYTESYISTLPANRPKMLIIYSDNDSSAMQNLISASSSRLSNQRTELRYIQSPVTITPPPPAVITQPPAATLPPATTAPPPAAATQPPAVTTPPQTAATPPPAASVTPPPAATTPTPPASTPTPPATTPPPTATTPPPSAATPPPAAATPPAAPVEQAPLVSVPPTTPVEQPPEVTTPAPSTPVEQPSTATAPPSAPLEQPPAVVTEPAVATPPAAATPPPSATAAPPSPRRDTSAEDGISLRNLLIALIILAMLIILIIIIVTIRRILRSPNRAISKAASDKPSEKTRTELFAPIKASAEEQKKTLAPQPKADNKNADFLNTYAVAKTKESTPVLQPKADNKNADFLNSYAAAKTKESTPVLQSKADNKNADFLNAYAAAKSRQSSPPLQPKAVGSNAEFLNSYAASRQYKSTSGLLIAAAAKRTSKAIPEDVPYEPIREGEDLMLNLFVEDQNTSIGRRNIHLVKKGNKFSIGGGKSDFLIFLFPFPRRIAELRYDRKTCTLIPIKTKYFPDIGSNEVPDCIGKNIRIISDRNFELYFIIERYKDPQIALNELLRSVSVPGEIKVKSSMIGGARRG